MDGKKERLCQIGGVRVKIRRKSIKNLYIRILPPNGHVVVTAPEAVTLGHIEAFVKKRLSWIRRQKRHMERSVLSLIPCLENGRILEYLGRSYTLMIRPSRQASISSEGSRLIFLVPEECEEGLLVPMLLEWYALGLRRVASAVIERYENRIRKRVRRLRIRAMKSRWGSCSASRAAITLNLDLARLRKELIEYVTVHEMAHLVRANHGAGFKALMDGLIPGWRLLDRELGGLSPVLCYLQKQAEKARW